jgi:hypothetical protein
LLHGVELVTLRLVRDGFSPTMKTLSFLALCTLTLPAFAADLVLLSEKKSEYQIVVPEKVATAELGECLNQTARLLQTAFKANGVEVAVVTEGKRDAARPGIYLGDTEFARRNGVEAAKLDGWSYVQSVVGRDLVIAGHDQASPVKAEQRGKRDVAWNFVGTAKGAADFARLFMGVRFLYPDLASYSQVSAAAKLDLLASPAIEFLPLKTMAVPGDWKVQKTPWLRINTAHPAGASFYDLAQNRFPRVDEMFGSHTWERAVPAEQFAAHPEYFALINGQRLKPDGGAQYCLSNPEVQESIYRDLAKSLDAGYGSVDLGQPDGFRECQCENCKNLFGTGGDWSEKIWIFNRNVAERLVKSHPKGRVTMMSYILTANPPKTFKEFPANVRIMLTGTNEEDIAPWRSVTVPGGFTGYVYNWCPNLGTRYTPMRTPGFVETQAKRLAAARIQSLYRDGPGQLFGLEGPVYYTMGRMYDDPDRNAAKDLVPEFCEAAFGPGAAQMRTFYDRLYHAITLYSDYIGTRCDVWTYQPLEGRRRKTVTDPFQLMAFLYPPNLLSALDADLTQAERLANSDKIKTRLALVRTEFEYLRHFARVVYLYQAFALQPDLASRDRLLEAIDARNAFIDALYDKRGRMQVTAGWAGHMFPFMGHDAKHLRLAHDGYQEPYANTCLNWDTKAMRNAPLPGKKRLAVTAVSGTVTLDGPEWQRAAANELTVVPPLNKLPRKTTVRMLYDKANLYIRAECELEPDGVLNFTGQRRDTDLRGKESLDIYLAPKGGSEAAYRFMTGANANAKYDAANGFISDVMDPRFGKDDPTWNGEWQSEVRVDEKGRRWEVMVTIPFKALGVEAPGKGATWRGNFARYHALPREAMDRGIWSSTPGSMSMEDRGLFGELAFE